MKVGEWIGRGGGHLEHRVEEVWPSGRVRFVCGREGWPTEIPPDTDLRSCDDCAAKRQSVVPAVVDERRSA